LVVSDAVVSDAVGPDAAAADAGASLSGRVPVIVVDGLAAASAAWARLGRSMTRVGTPANGWRVVGDR